MQYWRKTLEIMPDSYKQWFKAEEAYLQKHIKKNSTVLEVGCGDGRSLEYILGKTKKFFGVDIDSVAVLPAKKRFVDNPHSSIYLGDGRDLAYKDNFFDYVICMTTPVNFGVDKDAFYSEMRRVIKYYDGEIILSVFNEDSMEERMKVYNLLAKDEIEKIEGNKVFFKNGLGNLSVSEGFSELELRKIFLENSLRMKEIKKEGIGYFCRLGKDRRDNFWL